MIQTIKIKLVHPSAQVPRYATPGSACFDIHAIVEEPLGVAGVDKATVSIAPGHAAVIRTGLAFEVPEGWVLKVYSRSGHGFKDGVRLVNATGIIDSDYRGELAIGLRNDSHNKRFTIRHGARIAQAMLEPAQQHQLVVVEQLSETQRGAGGFGSTGQ